MRKGVKKIKFNICFTVAFIEEVHTLYRKYITEMFPWEQLSLCCTFNIAVLV